MTTNKTTDALLPCCAYCDKQMDIEETPSKIHDGVVIYRACCVNDDCVMDLSETKGYERLTDLKSALKTRAQPKPAQCPLGEDCDLTIAYMKGFSDGKADRPKPAQGDMAEKKK